MRPTQSDSATGIVAVWAAECIAALFVLLQRLTGMFEDFPSPTAVLVFAAVCLAVNLMGVVLLRSRPFSRDSEALRRGALPAVACTPPLVIGLSLLQPDATAQHAALWLIVLLAAGVTARIPRRTDCQSVEQTRCAGGVSPPHATQRFGVATADSTATAANGALQRDDEANSAGAARPRHAPGPSLALQASIALIPETPAPPPLQSMQRRLAEDGSQEILEGEFTAVFAAGQKTAVVHLAFCPPLAGIPQIECEPLDGPDVRWKTAVVQPYGVRIDVQRSGRFQDPAEVRLAWFATAECAMKEAA